MLSLRSAAAVLILVAAPAAVPAGVDPAVPSTAAQLPVSVVTGPPLLRLGGAAEKRDGYWFVQPNGALRLADGRIVVAACGLHELRFYMPDGTLQRRVGGEGDGPGEFRLMTRLRRTTADSLLTLDLFQRRTSLFSPDGDFVRSFNLPINEDVFGRFADGSFLAGRSIVEREPAPTPVIVWSHWDMRLRDAAGEVIEELGRYPRSETLLRGSASLGVVGGRFAALAVAGDRFYLGTQEAAEIRVLSASGTELQVIPTVTAPAPVTREFREATARAAAARAPAENRDGVLRRALETPWPGALPAYGRFLLGGDGRLWVQDGYRGSMEPRSWTAYRDGRAELRAVVPAGFAATDFGADWVLGITMDEMDIAAVELHRLPPATAGEVPPQESAVTVVGGASPRCWMRR